MMIYDRPDEKVMAESAPAGEVQDFPDILRGWGITFEQTGGLPPMEWFNALARRTDRAIRYFMQRGLPEWSPTESYPTNSIVQYSGNTYKSLRENTNKQPSSSASDWAAWSVVRSEFSASLNANGYQKLPSGLILQWGAAVQSGSGVTVALPISYPTANLLVLASPTYGAVTSDSNVVNVGVKNLTSFIAYFTKGNAYINGTIYWLSIGY